MKDGACFVASARHARTNESEAGDLLPRPTSARLIRASVRLAIGVGIVAILLARANVPEIADALRAADVADVAIGTILFFASLLLSSLRWEAFLRSLGISLPRRTLARLYLVGTFFNAFLPTGVGGDAYKSFIVGGGTAAIEPPLAAAALDRLAGVVGLAALTLIGTAALFVTSDATVVTWVSVAASVVLFLGCGYAVLRRRDATRRKESVATGLTARIRTFARALAVGIRHPHGLRVGSLFGMLTALLLVGAHLFLLQAVHSSVPVGAMPGIVLLASLTTAIPFTINGLGFRETTYVWALGAYGVPSDTALLFALVVLAVTLLSSAVGGVVYATGGSSLPRSLEDVEDGRHDQQIDPDEQWSDGHQDRRR
jgi:glycosyltransferase 2 family protein